MKVIIAPCQYKNLRWMVAI